MRAANRESRRSSGKRIGSSRAAAGIAWAFLAWPLVRGALGADLPGPIVDLRFSEGAGDSTANAGNLGGIATFAMTDAWPAFTDQVPQGAFAPADNDFAVDMGSIAAGQGGRAIDLLADGDGTLGPLDAFTVCGWLNARALDEGWGGNRIAFALASPDGPGFDLVQLASGALRIGINQWPDGANGGGPSSEPGRITADPAAGPGNWVFFAVTYDSALDSAQTKFWFGGPEVEVALDVEATYARGPIGETGALTLGNFGSVDGAREAVGPLESRCFRGLLDELRVFSRALDEVEIAAVQTAGVVPPPTGLRATPGDSMVRLDWDDVADAIGYDVYRDLEKVNGATVFDSRYDDVGLTNGVLHCYRVRAVAASSEGPLSAEACATPGGPGLRRFHRGDPNDDGAMNITDGIFVLNYLFLGGPAPPAPGPPDQPCGTAPAGIQEMGCDAYESC